MPITAKFSKKFYDTLGHDIADEMVDWFNRADEAYRADLYRINDLNFARFEAKVEQRFAEFEAKVATKAELRELRDELVGRMDSQRDEFLGRLADLRDELVGCLAGKKDLADFRTEMAERLGALQTDMHRKLLLYWGGFVGVVIAATMLG